MKYVCHSIMEKSKLFKQLSRFLNTGMDSQGPLWKLRQVQWKSKQFQIIRTHVTRHSNLPGRYQAVWEDRMAWTDP